ncbi:MAG: transglutaminase domain-containing protein [bacterium]
MRYISYDLIIIAASLLLLCLSKSTFSATMITSHHNPVYQHLYNEQSFSAHRLYDYGTPIECFSAEELKSTMRESYENRINYFSIHLMYDFSFSDIGNIVRQAFEEIMAEDDYLLFSYVSYRHEISGNEGDVIINYQVQYLTTHEQEEMVSERVTEVLAEIITDNMNYEEKEKQIHDWIVTHVAYDLSETNFSAYAALFLESTVCQGYALLTHKMMNEALITTRIIPGQAGGVNHAWNMVELCGKWYHVDVTWDDPVPDISDYVEYNYFNKSDSEIELTHTWDKEQYPSAPLAYEEGLCSNISPPDDSEDNDQTTNPPADSSEENNEILDENETVSACFITAL